MRRFLYPPFGDERAIAASVEHTSMFAHHNATRVILSAPTRNREASSWVDELKLTFGGPMHQNKKNSEKRIDKAVDMTFLASDPTAHGKPTGTETPCRPVDRKVPKITKEQIEQAQRGEGHKHQVGS
jgi:hypothetical protein